jgi:hypothetical protein
MQQTTPMQVGHRLAEFPEGLHALPKAAPLCRIEQFFPIHPAAHEAELAPFGTETVRELDQMRVAQVEQTPRLQGQIRSPRMAHGQTLEHPHAAQDPIGDHLNLATTAA